jgi:hypothetical protein
VNLRLRLPSGVRWSGAVVVAVVAIAVAAIVVAAQFPSSIRALLRRGVGEVQPDLVEQLLVRHTELSDLAVRRVEGRSAFFVPRPPPPPRVDPPPPPPPPPRSDPPPPPPPPPPPATYGGPKPRSLFGEVVFFEAGQGVERVRVGEQFGAIRVLAVNPPWSVRIGWSGGEYEVPIWGERNPSLFQSNPFASSSSIPALEGRSDLNPRTASVPEGGVASRGSGASGRPASPPPSSPSPPPSSGGEPMGEPPMGEEEPFASPESLPPALVQQEIEAMTRDEARAALGAVARARGRRLDDQSRERLRQEFEWLLARLRQEGD